jgi:hypothetical protein
MMEWINCSDRLPSENEKVLIHLKSGHIETDYISNPKDGNLWSFVCKNEITHWMPLPEPPKDDS